MNTQIQTMSKKCQNRLRHIRRVRFVSVTPLVATYPLVTVALSAVLLTSVRVTAKLACGTVAAVAGVILVLVG